MWLDVFLLGWISMASIPVIACEIPHCVYASLCVFCHVPAVHYLVTWGDMLLCYFFFVPTSYMCCCQCVNFFKGKTSHERRTRKFHSANIFVDDRDVVVSLLNGQEGGEVNEQGRPQQESAGFCGAKNCYRMCCPKKQIN